MSNASAELGRKITLTSSKQSYYTVRLLVDKSLQNDCLRAYAYLRWVDDVIDRPDLSSAPIDSCKRSVTFIRRQQEIVSSLYRREVPEDLTPEENMVADLILSDPQVGNGLHSFICNFLDVLEFDAHRKGRLISEGQLEWYSNQLGKSVTDGIQYFIGNGHPYREANNRYLAATAAHITHMLRDMKADLEEGFINIPRERLDEWGLDGDVGALDVREPYFRDWVRERVNLARRYIHHGKQYLNSLEFLRCKIAGYWYCARFEIILDAIERDNYNLQTDYMETKGIATWLKIAWIGCSLTFQHISQRIWSIRDVHRNLGKPELDSEPKRCRMNEMNW